MALPQVFFAGIDTLGMTLLHFLWEGALIGLMYALMRPLCTGVAARYRLGVVALVALTLAPLGTAMLLWPTTTASMPAATAAVSVRALAVVAGPAMATVWRLQPILPWLVGAWLCGVLLIVARSLQQWRRLVRLVHTANPVAAQWENILARLCACFGVRRPVRLLCSAAAVTPMLIGWLKPVILLPASMLSGFTVQEVELIIAHELGHIRRFDYLVNLFQVAVETVLFYHPVVHWISRDVRNTREACCDDLVLQLAHGNRLAYARALADLEELRLAAPALGARGGVLLARIRRIVGESDPAEPMPRSYTLPFLLVCAAVVTLLWRPQHAELDAALTRVPAQALALLGRTAFEVDVPALSLNLPRPDVQPVRANVALQTAPVADTGNKEISSSPLLAAAEPSVAAAQPAPAAPMQVETPIAEPPVAAPPAAAPESETSRAAPLHVVPPEYPPRAMVAGIEGAVELEYRIAADGSVGQIRIISARPAGVFDDAAKTALRGWRFPASSAGEKRRQNFAFTLHGQTKPDEQCETPTGSLICRRPGA